MINGKIKGGNSVHWDNPFYGRSSEATVNDVIMELYNSSDYKNMSDFKCEKSDSQIIIQYKSSTKGYTKDKLLHLFDFIKSEYDVTSISIDDNSLAQSIIDEKHIGRGIKIERIYNIYSQVDDKKLKKF